MPVRNVDKPRARIIFLNGASSSGKTTLGRALQQAAPFPLLYFSSDQLVDAQVLPAIERRHDAGPWAWKTIRPRFFDGFHRCIAALADAGNDLVVEHVVEHRTWLEDCVSLLASHDVFYVGVHCGLAELERREVARGDRIPGEGRSHLEDGIHAWSAYDFEIDTSAHDTATCVRLVLEAFAVRQKPGVFDSRHSGPSES